MIILCRSISSSVRKCLFPAKGALFSGYPTKARTMYDFARGHPNKALLPLHEMQEILTKAASAENQERLLASMNYLESDQGDPDLRDQISAFVDRHTLDDSLGTPPPEAIKPVSAPSSNIFLTHGVSHGLEMLCTTQTKPGDVVLIERPTYFLAADIFESHGLTLDSLPMCLTGGVDVDKLAQLLESGKLEPPRMIYIIPTHQNPTARSTSIEDRWKLSILAARYGILVAADEVYHLLDWRDLQVDGPRPARMALIGSYLEELASRHKPKDGRLGGCVTVSAFTKIFSPGVRCGWIEGSPEIIKSLVDLGYIKSQGGCVPFTGELLRISLTEGIGDRVLNKLNSAYKQRVKLLCDILQTDSRIEIDTTPQGGYFVWVAFPGVATEEFLGICMREGVKFLPGGRCDPFKGEENVSASRGLDHNEFKSHARLCFADMDLEEIENGAKLLVLCYQEMAGPDIP